MTSIPQTILFGRSPAGMNSTGTSDMENYYNYVQRIQKRMLKSNLRYLLSVIFQAGLYTGEVKEVPPIKISFSPLWSLSEKEQAELEQAKAAVQQTKAQTAQIYVDMGSIDPTEVRQKLADSEEFNVETILDDYSDDELFENMSQQEKHENAAQTKAPGKIFEQGDFNDYLKGNSPDAAPEATKLPQDMDGTNRDSMGFLIDKSHKIGYNNIIHKNNDGGEGSGNFGHKGVPGEVGGSAPSPSAKGENVPCVGFETSDKLSYHAGRHGKREMGIKSDEEYLSHAVEFLKQPCSDTIDGYITSDGQICRFDRTTGEYAKGVPGGKVTTCFIARFNEKTGKANLEAANRYFDKCKDKEGVEEDGGEIESKENTT